ncbi:MAG TPA: ABC transporter substrate-binding protein [Acidimicrobiales bacterium]|nr:ABC transporter substrate-binding protein [Acidimicrobiales bacterium]
MKNRYLQGVLATAVLVAGTLVAPAFSGSSGAASGGTIQIASLGALTGALTSSLGGQPTGVDAWVKYTNARGGIAGHKIKLAVGDTKSTPGQEAAVIQSLNSSSHPVAIVGVGTDNLGSAITYLTQNNLPVVGGNSSDLIWNQSPMLYPQGATQLTEVYALAASQKKGSKFGLIYCVEAPNCAVIKKELFTGGLAKLGGVNPVYSAQVSLSAPSFTAQCLAAKAAGTQVISLSMDPVDSLRLASNCASQGYKPIYTATAIAAPLSGTGFQTVSANAVNTNLPWTVTKGAGKTFHQAMSKYEPGKPQTDQAMEGWASGVEFGTAAAIALKTGKPLTSASLQAALRTFKNQTLGGLAPPLTFVKKGPEPLSQCWFTSVLNNGVWKPGKGGKTTCAPKSVMPTLQKMATEGSTS